MEKLQHLLNEGIIDEVFQQLKTGKEAEVWLVSHRGEPVAAKLYKEREFRSFKNDSGYLEGRQVRNTRTQRAMNKGTAFGKKAAEEAWKSAEADAMYALHAAGVRVPKPVLFYDGVLLMEVIGDHEGRVAPRLVEAVITPEQALPMYLHLRGEVVKMLCADLIHGDLSEFNVLLGIDGPVIIDFPQVVAAARNSKSEQFFQRDLGNLVRFFSSLNPEVQKHAGDAAEIWRAYTRRELSVGFVPTGRGVPQQQARPNQQPQGGRDKRPFRPDQGAPRGQNDRRGGNPLRGANPRDDQRGPPNRGNPNQSPRGQSGHPNGRDGGTNQPPRGQSGNPNGRDGGTNQPTRGQSGTPSGASTRGGNQNGGSTQSRGNPNGRDGQRGGANQPRSANPNARDGQRGGNRPPQPGQSGQRNDGRAFSPNPNSGAQQILSGTQRRGPEVSFKGSTPRPSRPQHPRPSSNRRR